MRTTAVLGVVVIAALASALVVLTGQPTSAAPTAGAGSACAPYTAFPTVKLGHHASVSVALDGVEATFAATATKEDTIPAVPSGMPFTGVLTVTSGTKRWVLPRPSMTKDYQIDYLCVIRFSKGQGPAVLTEGFTGGAHCCELPVLYSLQHSSDRFVKVLDLTPTNVKYSLAFDNNGGFRPQLVGGRVLLRTEDDRFAYTFGCYACAPMPIVLDAFDGTHLVDVTGQYPSLIRPEAASFLKLATTYAKGEHNPSYSGIGPFGALAAWVADECTLDRGATAWNQVLAFQSAGELSNKVYYADTLNKGSYVAQLRRFLLTGDYCTGQFGE
jgi:hypothetical protein